MTTSPAQHKMDTDVSPGDFPTSSTGSVDSGIMPSVIVIPHQGISSQEVEDDCEGQLSSRNNVDIKTDIEGDNDIIAEVSSANAAVMNDIHCNEINVGGHNHGQTDTHLNNVDIDLGKTIKETNIANQDTDNKLSTENEAVINNINKVHNSNNCDADTEDNDDVVLLNNNVATEQEYHPDGKEEYMRVALVDSLEYDPHNTMDHTHTHSVILDEEQTDYELQQVFNGGEQDIQTLSNDCAMCQFCQANQQHSHDTTLGVDFNIGVKPRVGSGGYRMLATNTPNNMFLIDGRASQGTQPETKEEVYQQALSLMSQRCISRPGSKGAYLPINKDAIAVGLHAREGTQTPLVSTKSYPYGIQQPEYFFIHQQKPTPMPPIPAWKGYSGNVYFSPISIQQTHPVEAAPPKTADLDRCTPELQQILRRSRSRASRSMKSPSLYSIGSSSNMESNTSNRRSMSGDSRNRRMPDRSTSIMSYKSSKSSNTNIAGCRHLLQLDKEAVLTASNDNIEEEVVVLASQESTGSLRVLGPSSNSNSRGPSNRKHNQRNTNTMPEDVNEQNKIPYSQLKEKIHKGSMARQMSGRSQRRRPLLSVSGDKFSEPQCPSPLLRTQTQYSQSSQRGVLVSPELSYHSFTQSYEKLPPLEHLRASLRQIENSPSKESLVQFISPQERMKFEESKDYKKTPFIKFSPELRKRPNAGNKKQTHSVNVKG